MKLFNLEMDSTVFKSGVFLTKFGQKLLLFYLLSLIMCENVEKKIIARTYCFTHHSIFRPNYILITILIFRLSRTKIPFGLFLI